MSIENVLNDDDGDEPRQAELAPYSNNPKEYYDRLKKELGDEVVEKLNPLLDDLTVDQLRCLSRYCDECCRAMSREMEKTVTMNDFEMAKKTDIDGDNEEGESEDY